MKNLVPSGSSFKQKFSNLEVGFKKVGDKIMCADFACVVLCTSPTPTNVSMELSGSNPQSSNQKVGTDQCLQFDALPLLENVFDSSPLVYYDDLTLTVEADQKVFLLAPNVFRGSGMGIDKPAAFKSVWWGNFRPMSVPGLTERASGEKRIAFPYSIYWRNFGDWPNGGGWIEGWDTVFRIVNTSRQSVQVTADYKPLYNTLWTHPGCTSSAEGEASSKVSVGPGGNSALLLSTLIGADLAKESRQTEGPVFFSGPDSSWTVDVVVQAGKGGKRICLPVTSSDAEFVVEGPASGGIEILSPGEE